MVIVVRVDRYTWAGYSYCVQFYQYAEFDNNIAISSFILQIRFESDNIVYNAACVVFEWRLYIVFRLTKR